MTTPPLPCYLAGVPTVTSRTLQVPDRFTGAPAFSVCIGTVNDFDTAISAAHTAVRPMMGLPMHARAAALQRVSWMLEENADRFARTIVIEAGKPIRDARSEVARAVETFAVAAAECGRTCGEFLRLDSSVRGGPFRAISQRVPVGPVALITPFNFPLNLVAHKVAPAIAAGCPWVLKPSDKAPVSALMLGELLRECALPAGSWSILPSTVQDAGALVADERLKLLSFTGSAEVGWDLKSRCGKKKIVLELGGNAAAVVCRDSDPSYAVQRLMIGIYSNSGQSCISVQRVLVHRELYETVRDGLVAASRVLPCGDPRLDATIVGPLIDESAAQRLENWIRSAASAGARVLCGGNRRGSMLEPTLLEHVPDACDLSSLEAFGPVAVLEPFDDFDAALDRVNTGRFGLQCGIFTRDLGQSLKAWDRTHVGAVVINEVPTFRTEAMPYGGIKESGLGREGIRASIDEYTEPRLLVINQDGLI